MAPKLNVQKTGADIAATRSGGHSYALNVRLGSVPIGVMVRRVECRFHQTIAIVSCTYVYGGMGAGAGPKSGDLVDGHHQLSHAQKIFPLNNNQQINPAGRQMRRHYPHFFGAYQAAVALTELLTGREAAKAIHNLIQRKACSLSADEPADAICIALSTAMTAR